MQVWFCFKDTFFQGRKRAVTHCSLSPTKGTTREHISVTESHGEPGVSPWQQRSRLGCSQWGPGTRSISRLREPVEKAESTELESAFSPDPRGCVHRLRFEEH